MNIVNTSIIEPYTDYEYASMWAFIIFFIIFLLLV
jgi:hypothetical protein